jgi:hypothetical protein
MDELVAKLESYLNDSISLEDFECWFYGLTFDIEKRLTGSVVEMAYEIEGILGEASSAGWPSHILRLQLESILSSYSESQSVLSFSFAPSRSFRAASSSAVIGFPVWQSV